MMQFQIVNLVEFFSKSSLNEQKNVENTKLVCKWSRVFTLWLSVVSGGVVSANFTIDFGLLLNLADPVGKARQYWLLTN